MDSDKAPTSQMVASTQSGPVIAIGWRPLKQPKLSRTEHPRVEQMKKFQRQITRRERGGTRKQEPRECIRASGSGIGVANR